MNPAPTCSLANGFECCVFCWIPFGGEDDPERHVPYPSMGAGIHFEAGPVVDVVDGTEYDHLGKSPAGSPLAHPECYREWVGDDEHVNTCDTRGCTREADALLREESEHGVRFCSGCLEVEGRRRGWW